MIDIRENISLKPYHTFHIDVSARYFVEYDTVDELKQFLSSPLLKENKYLHIGAGSNLLFTSDFEGVIIHSRMRSMSVVSEDETSVSVEVQSGMVWDDFVANCVAEGWGGVENLSHIPGEVGASAVQNVGAYGVESKDVIETVRGINITTLQERTFTNADCRYSYRKSIFKEELKGQYIITSVTFRLCKTPVFRLDYGSLRTEAGECPTLASVREAVINIRRRKLPEPDEKGSAGSFFMNPVVEEEFFRELKSLHPDIVSYPAPGGKIKISAAWLIDRAGWHGKSFGGASVYPKQCLVIVNDNNATTADVINLAEAIRKSVFEKYNVAITPEVNYI